MSEYIVLNNGNKMPMIGLGTSKSKGAVIKNAVAFAIEAGYRHIDCAYVYGNESEIGDAIHLMITKRKVKREELFVSSKLGCSFQHPDCLEDTFERTLSNLKLDYLDLYYIHWPFALKYSGPESFFPSDEQGNPIFDETIDFVDTWRVLERLYKCGKIKALGISNFNVSQLERILDNCDIIPAVHQFECHPYLSQDEMLKFCKARGIATVGYSPLGSPDRAGLAADSVLLKNETLLDLAKQSDKTVAQIVLRYLLQQDVCVVPRSTDAGRIAENIDLFNFKLSAKDCATVKGLNRNCRFISADKFSKHIYFPFC